MERIIIDDNHYCMFEINKETKKYTFVTDFGADYAEAKEYCQAMNDFRTSNMPVYFCIRCLSPNEFDNIKKYNPIAAAIVIKQPRND